MVFYAQKIVANNAFLHTASFQLNLNRAFAARSMLFHYSVRNIGKKNFACVLDRKHCERTGTAKLSLLIPPTVTLVRFLLREIVLTHGLKYDSSEWGWEYHGE